MSDFQQKLFLTILDKGVLAIVALVFGYWISKRMESYKTDQQRLLALERDKVGLRSELDKLRRTHQIDFKEKQLSSFYWPIYFRFMKDSAMWKIIPQLSNSASALPDKIGREIELSYLIKNHEENVSIIENNIHLAQADPQLLADINAYIRHVAVYKTLRVAKIYDRNPIDVNEAFPQGLIGNIEKRLKELQAEYDELVSAPR
jgi:hypothetical protein